MSEEVTPIFGLRCPEEDAAELNAVAGCNTVADIFFNPADLGATPEHVTYCDYIDYDGYFD